MPHLNVEKRCSLVAWTGCEGDPALLTLSVERISSGTGFPQIDWPPFPVPVGSPVCTMKFRMLR